MKRILVSLVSLLLLMASCKQKNYVGSNGVEFTSAIEYNDYIITRQKTVVSEISRYGNAAQVNADSAEIILDKTVEHIGNMLVEIKGMPAFNGDSSFRDAAIELFNFYKKSFSTDFKEMLNINRKVELDTFDESDIARFKQIEEDISKKENPLDAKLKEMQMQFAKKNNLKLTDNSVQKEIDKMGK